MAYTHPQINTINSWSIRFFEVLDMLPYFVTNTHLQLVRTTVGEISKTWNYVQLTYPNISLNCRQVLNSASDAIAKASGKGKKIQDMFGPQSASLVAI